MESTLNLNWITGWKHLKIWIYQRLSATVIINLSKILIISWLEWSITQGRSILDTIQLIVGILSMENGIISTIPQWLRPLWANTSKAAVPTSYFMPKSDDFSVLLDIYYHFYAFLLEYFILNINKISISSSQTAYLPSFCIHFQTLLTKTEDTPLLLAQTKSPNFSSSEHYFPLTSISPANSRWFASKLR